MNIKPPVPLSVNEKIILDKFISKFLPPKNRVRRGKDIEIQAVHGTIDKVFKKFFGFSVSPTHVMDSFSQMEYHISTKGSVWNYDKKDIVPSDIEYNGKMLIANNYRYDVYEKFNGDFIYINIDSATVKALSTTRMTLSPDTSSEKLTEQQRLLKAIIEFKETIVAPH